MVLLGSVNKERYGRKVESTFQKHNKKQRKSNSFTWGLSYYVREDIM